MNFEKFEPIDLPHSFINLAAIQGPYFMSQTSFVTSPRLPAEAEAATFLRNKSQQEMANDSLSDKIMSL